MLISPHFNMPETTGEGSPFLKQLASSNSQTRRDALDSLRLYLSRRARFEPLELLKLWKGLFFCMWMSDRSLAQQRLARDLASLLDDTLSEENALPFLDAFWKTMAREWVGIDVLRMDKFLFLVRQELAAGLRFCARGGKWDDDGRTKEYLRILEETPFSVEMNKVPDGMKYHVLDIYVDELDKVDTIEGQNEQKQTRSGNMPLDALLGPVKRMQKLGPMKTIRTRAAETLEDERLRDWEAPSKASPADADEEFTGFGD